MSFEYYFNLGDWVLEVDADNPHKEYVDFSPQ